MDRHYQPMDDSVSRETGYQTAEPTTNTSDPSHEGEWNKRLTSKDRASSKLDIHTIDVVAAFLVVLVVLVGVSAALHTLEARARSSPPATAAAPATLGLEARVAQSRAA